MLARLANSSIRSKKRPIAASIADAQCLGRWAKSLTWLASFGGYQAPHLEDIAKTVIHVGAEPADTIRLGDVVAERGLEYLQSKDEEGVQLGSQQYDQSCTLDGKPSVALSIYQLPGYNALDTAKGVYAKMRELKKRFPAGVDYKIVYDTTPFIQESVDEVFNTPGATPSSSSRSWSCYSCKTGAR